jgi:nucleoside-diphosphate-sugar epimerase
VLSAITPDKGRGADTFVKNSQIAASVCAALERVSPAQLVYISSDAVYPMTAGLVSEATCAEPPDLYGAMHLSRELMFKAIAKCPLAVLRPTLVFGTDDTHNSYGPNRLRRTARKDGKITLFGDGEEMRDHMHVDDVVSLISLTLRHRSSGTINLASGHSVSYAELARKVAALFDRKIEIIGSPRQSPVTHRHFDITALRAAFPTFVFTSQDEGLARAHSEMFELE